MFKLLGRLPANYGTDVIKNETMLFSADPMFAWDHGGPITRHAVKLLADTHSMPMSSQVVIDTRVHMLKPGWVPAIGGWHCDAIPRGADGQPDFDHPSIPGIRHVLLCIDAGTGSMTEFLNDPEFTSTLPRVAPEGKNLWGAHSEAINARLDSLTATERTRKVTTARSGFFYGFDSSTYHRAIPATGHGWRYFLRASYGTVTKGPFNEIRKQVQVYLPDEDLGW